MTPNVERVTFTKKKKTVACPVPLAPLADTHAHLLSFWSKEVPETLARAKEAGIDLNPQAPVDQKKGIFGFLGGSKEPKLEAKSESKVLPPPAPAAAPELSVPASETKDQKTTDQAPAASSNADGGEPKKGLFGKFFH